MSNDSQSEARALEVSLYNPRIVVEGMGEDSGKVRRFAENQVPSALTEVGRYMKPFMPEAPNLLSQLNEVRVEPQEDGLGGYVNPRKPRVFHVNGKGILKHPRFLWHTFRHEPLHIIQALGGVIDKYGEASVNYFTKLYSEAYGRVNPRLKEFGEFVGYLVGLQAQREIIEGQTSLATSEITGERSGDAYEQRGWTGRMRHVANRIGRRFYTPEPDNLGRRIVFNPQNLDEATNVVRAYGREAGLVPVTV